VGSFHLHSVPTCASPWAATSSPRVQAFVRLPASMAMDSKTACLLLEILLCGSQNHGQRPSTGFGHLSAEMCC
jgi:hypothetical protein